jgi:transposase
MLIPTSILKALVRIDPIDFRRGIDGLIGLVSQTLKQDPRSGTAFIFRNKKGTSIKVLYYDGWAYWLCQRRLSQGTLRHWPRSEDAVMSVNLQQLILLLLDGNLNAANFRPAFHSVT